MRFSKVNEIFNYKLEPFDNPENNDLSYCLYIDTLFSKNVIGQCSFIFKDRRLFSFKCSFYGDELTPLNEFYLVNFNDSTSLINNTIVYVNKEKPNVGKFYKLIGKTPEKLLATYVVTRNEGGNTGDSLQIQ